LTRWQSSSTDFKGLPQAVAKSSHVFRLLWATSRALIAMSEACPRAIDFGWFSNIVAFGRAKRFPRLPCAYCEYYRETKEGGTAIKYE
jgi:hypothetical protein